MLGQDQGLEQAAFADKAHSNAELAAFWCSQHDASKAPRTAEARIGEALALDNAAAGGIGALVWVRRNDKGKLLAVRKAPPCHASAP